MAELELWEDICALLFLRPPSIPPPTSPAHTNMQTRRSTVLGKRGHQDSSSPAPAPTQVCEQLQTPDNTPHPKRPRTSSTFVDDGSNKENIPPLSVSPINGELTPRAARMLRRTSTTEAITPPRSRPVPRRTASVASMPPATPSTEISALAIATPPPTPPPTPPTSLLPIHSRARALLRSTCNNTQAQMAGRDNERAAILSFLAPFIEGTSMNDDEAVSSMFISGSPGTGKTALVNAIIRELSSDTNCDVKVISINCMALKSVDGLWERMIEEFGEAPKRKSAAGKKLKGRDAVTSLLNGFNTKSVLILDELDHITPNEQTLSSIFTLTETLSTTLRLIAIANTHTLTSPSSSTSFPPSSNVQTIHFAPYTPAQLQDILQTRLKSLSDDEQAAMAMKKFLPTPTLTLLTKKIASLTGDVRSVFEVLRGAIELAVAASAPKSEDENPLNTPATSVTPQHVLGALKAYTPASAAPKTSNATTTTPTLATSSNNETVTKIRNLGLQARLVLLNILLASKRLEAGLTLSSSSQTSPKKPTASPMKRTLSAPVTSSRVVGIETGSLHTYYTAVLSRTELGIFEPISRVEFGDLMGVLEGVGLVSLSSSLLSSASVSPSKGKRAFGRSASFGGGLGKNGAGAVGEVRLVEGLWADEILRGLGVTAVASPADAREEEVRGIWEREKTRLAKDLRASLARPAELDTFAGAYRG